MIIKQTPEDFIVEEIPLRKPTGEGDYIWFWLEKVNYTTTRAIMQIARALRVSKVRFGFAGNKDKYAHTKQVVSAWKIEPEQLENIKLKDITIKVIGKSDKRICLGDLNSNKFDIIVRDLEKKELEEAKERLKLRGFVPNYFGSQRFGPSENTHKVGRFIIKGELEKAAKEFLIGTTDNKEAKEYLEVKLQEIESNSSLYSEFAKKNWGKWKEILAKCPKFLGLEKAVLNWLIKNPTDFAGALRTIPKSVRRLFVHAYQSYIFNLALSKYLEQKVKCDRIKFLDTTLAFPKKKVDSTDIKPIIPGTKMRFRKDKFSESIKEILEKEKISVEDFRVKRMPELASEGALREPFIEMGEIGLELLGEDNIKLKFELSKGSYATVVLMWLFKT